MRGSVRSYFYKYREEDKTEFALLLGIVLSFIACWRYKSKLLRRVRCGLSPSDGKN